MLSDALLKFLAIGCSLYFTTGVSAVLGAVVGVIMWLMGIVEPKAIPVCIVFAIIGGIILLIIAKLDN